MATNTSMKDQLKKAFPNRGEKKLSPSCLNPYNRIMRIKPGRKDGVDHINISTSGVTKLGRKLAPEFKFTFKHSFGSFISLEVFMAFINTPDFPNYLLKPIKGRSVARELSKLKLKRKRLPNYWSIVVDGMWQRLSSDPGLMEKLKKSDLPFTAYHIEKTKPQTASLLISSESKELEVIHYHHNMGRYVGVWEEFRRILKAHETLEEQVKAVAVLIREARDEPDKDILSGVPFIDTSGIKEISDEDIENIKISDEDQTSKPEETIVVESPANSEDNHVEVGEASDETVEAIAKEMEESLGGSEKAEELSKMTEKAFKDDEKILNEVNGDAVTAAEVSALEAEASPME